MYQFFGVVVEKNARSGLALEVNAVHIFAGHLHDLDLNLSLLEERQSRFALRRTHRLSVF